MKLQVKDDIDRDLEISDEEIFEIDEIYPTTIQVKKVAYSVFEMKRKHSSDKPRVILDSSFQRNHVWKENRPSELIESVLMGLPLPVFYFYQDKHGHLIVIDGRQRLTALFDYMDNKYPLRKLKILGNLNNKNFTNLEPVMQSRLEDYQIEAYVIMPPTPDRIKFDIFDRVNRGGVPLNKQEIRNALYQGNATELLNTLTNTVEFAKATGNSFSIEKRMKDKYLIIRYLSMLLYKEEMIKGKGNERYVFSGDIDEILGLTMECLNAMDENEVSKIIKDVKHGLTLSYFCLGENVFRIRWDGVRTPINMNVFESIMLIMHMLPDDLENCYVDVIKEKVRSFVTGEQFLDNINSHRDNKNKWLERVNMSIELGKDILYDIRGAN